MLNFTHHRAAEYKVNSVADCLDMSAHQKCKFQAFHNDLRYTATFTALSLLPLTQRWGRNITDGTYTHPIGCNCVNRVDPSLVLQHV